MVLSLGVSALGTVSWTAPRDLIFTGARSFNTACDILFSHAPLATSSTTVVGFDFKFFYALGANSSGKVDIFYPIPAKEIIFVAFSAIGSAMLYFDEVISAEK